jgi:hypothetical protein
VVPSESRGPLVSDAELMAALAEVQAASKAGAAAVPSLDDPPPSEPAEGAASESSAARTDATSEAKPVHTEPRFKIGSTAARRDSESSGTEDAADAGETPARPATPLSRRAYRAADAVLDLLNRPFFWLNGGVRNLVGSLALTTIAVALSAWLLLPLLVPNRDAVSFLAEKRAAMNKAQAANEVPTEASTEDGAGAGH